MVGWGGRENGKYHGIYFLRLEGKMSLVFLPVFIKFAFFFFGIGDFFRICFEVTSKTYVVILII